MPSQGGDNQSLRDTQSHTSAVMPHSLFAAPQQERMVQHSTPNQVLTYLDVLHTPKAQVDEPLLKNLNYALGDVVITQHPQSSAPLQYLTAMSVKLGGGMAEHTLATPTPNLPAMGAAPIQPIFNKRRLAHTCHLKNYGGGVKGKMGAPICGRIGDDGRGPLPPQSTHTNTTTTTYPTRLPPIQAPSHRPQAAPPFDKGRAERLPFI